MVVLDTGVGETYRSWEPVIEALSQESRVCSYDRAGYGQSEAGPMPRNSLIAAEELQALLTNSGETGPYILVGHSLGGLNLQVFADRFPEHVAGMVLLDPSPIGWMIGDGFAELRNQFNQQAEAIRKDVDSAAEAPDPEQRVNGADLEAVASELEEFFGRTASQVSAVPSFGSLPLRIIGATVPDPGFGEFGESFQRYWNDESRRLAEKSQDGHFVIAEGSSHHIHLDAPEIVINTVLELIHSDK